MNFELLHKEIRFRMSRSSGSGGQHVNKVSTRVELLFDVDGSTALSDARKALIRERLSRRITQEGLLIVACEEYRSQWKNRKEALKKFDEIIEKALKPKPRRKKVKPLAADREKRLKEKKHRAEVKAGRGKVLMG
jgi:ribosome-associated protein